MGRLPNFFIIGAPKCGTTALSEYLRQHPQVFFSNPKEPHFFNDDFSARHTYDFETYLSYFKAAEPYHKAIGEGSVFYLFSRAAVPNILKVIPEAKFIVMLRNPVDLAYSWHSQAVFSFGEDVLDFERAWSLQEERKRGKHIPEYNIVREALYYGDLAKLGEQVERLLRIVPKNRVHFIIFDDFKKNTREEYLKVIDFLNLDHWEPASYEIINRNKKIKSIKMHFMIEKVRILKRKLGIRMNLGLGTKIQQFNKVESQRPPLSSQMKERLKGYFRDDVEKLSNILGRDFVTLWLK
ncbi:sulfotransferase family protein [Desulfurobacterium sp.]